MTWEITINLRRDNPSLHFGRVERYVVEAWDTKYDMMTPVGTAYVAVFQGTDFDPVLEYVLVREDYRRQGVGTALVQECLNSWGDDLVITGPCSPEGDKLYEKFTGQPSGDFAT